jgi:hypothetical protein
MVATPSLIAVVERDRLGLGRRETWMGCNFEAHEAVPSRITLWLRISSSFHDQLRDHVLVPDGAFYMRMNKDYLHQGSLFSTPELIELFICRGAQLEPEHTRRAFRAAENRLAERETCVQGGRTGR